MSVSALGISAGQHELVLREVGQQGRPRGAGVGRDYRAPLASVAPPQSGPSLPPDAGPAWF